MRFTLVCCLLLILTTIPAWSWGMNGHRVVGAVAARHLTAPAAKAVEELLEGQTLAEAGTWADEIRSRQEWRVADPWHYINVEDPETIEEVLGRGTANVISEIERFRRILEDSSADRVKRAEALKFIIHFVGDLHQPLHVGRLGDRGGNGTHVTWFRKSSNLHTVWDTELVDFISLSYSELARWLTPPSYSQLIEWQSGTVRDWSQESFDLRGKVYDIGSGNLSFEYADRSVPIVRQRLLQAGVRLAGLLNSIFY